MAKAYYATFRKLIDQSSRFIGRRGSAMVTRTGISGTQLTEYNAWVSSINAIQADAALPEYKEQP